MNVMNGTGEKTSWQVFGPWLRSQRERAGKPRKQVAAAIGIHAVQLARIESGESGTKRETLDALIAELSLDAKEAYIKAGFMPAEDPGTIDQGAQAERAAKLIKGFLNMTPELQSQILAIIDVLQSDHPELLEIMTPPIEIVDDTDLTESDVIEIEGNTPP